MVCEVLAHLSVGKLPLRGPCLRHRGRRQLLVRRNPATCRYFNETATSNSNPRVYVNGCSGFSIEEAQMDTYDMYGAYYNYATISPDICPTGWRVPNSATFNPFFGGALLHGGSGKTSGTVEEPAVA